jgi:DNA replication and repair protein RecF
VLACAGERVGVTRLVLTEFRNYSTARIDLEPVPVVLTGPNGAGKTNLLEAVSFLSPGRGLRRARLSDVDRQTVNIGSGSNDGAPAPRPYPASQGWAVAATLSTRRGSVRIGTGRDGIGGDRRVVRIDGEPASSQAALGERVGIVWLTPQMDRLFLEGPAGRRRFLDRLVFGLDPAHAGRVTDYEQALRERGRLLRDGRRDTGWLSALEDVMAASGVAIAAARLEAIEQIGRECAEAEGPFPRAHLQLSGSVESWLADEPALAAEERLKTALASARAEDAVAGGATIGPHRSDLAVAHAEKGVAAEHASTGEQKALLISILLAHGRLQRTLRGEPPVMLLDEVAAHLDRTRREALFEILAGLESQTWLTGTDAALFAPLRSAARFISVSDGTLSDTE